MTADNFERTRKRTVTKVENQEKSREINERIHAAKTESRGDGHEQKQE
jgi:hypothetical protein